MYCTACGDRLDSAARYCPRCGTAIDEAASAVPTGPARRLMRARTGRKIAGVCQGLAQYLQIDATLVRILAICLALWPPFPGVIAYVAGWVVMPEEPLMLPPASRPSQQATQTPAVSGADLAQATKPSPGTTNV